MNWLVVLVALIFGQVSGQITIPTDNCEWRDQTYGEWNMCYGNEIAIGTRTGGHSKGIILE